MSKEKKYESLYNNLSTDTLNMVKKLNKEKKNNFLVPTRSVASENVQLAYLLNEYYNLGRTEESKKNYRSYFANSCYEAFQGVVKLIRHNGLIKKKKEIIVLEIEEDIKSLLVNPLNNSNQEDYLIPGLTFVETFEELNRILHQSNSIAGIILRNTREGLSFKESSSIIKSCKEKGVITVWDDSNHRINDEFMLHKFTDLTDIVILGEPLTNNEVPFSIFSMTYEIHKPWTSPQTCQLHTSTYGGNKIAVCKSLEVMLNSVSSFRNSTEIKEIFSKIDNSIEETLKYFSAYINPGMIKFYSTLGYDFICENGSGSWLSIKNKSGEKRKVLDAVSGAGSAARGHCLEDVYTCVLSKHSIEEDYWEKLAKELRAIYSLPHVFPAISGATAVEIALILSLVAAGDKQRTIVFKDNFAGNTLISLIATVNKSVHSVFKPIYKNVTYIDPFDVNAEKQLISELEKGDVGLIWLELIQGATLQEIPDKLVNIIQKNKDKYGYFIGIDEILMGFHRSSKFASYHNTNVQPDVITFSKALADGTFPMAATMVSEDIYNKASMMNSKIVSAFEVLYKNQFGSHIALNSIKKLAEPSTIAQIERTSLIIKEGLNQIQKSSPFIKEVRGKGHIYRLIYKNSLMSVYFCKRALEKEDLFLYIDKIIPSLIISEHDAKELISRLKSLYDGVGNPILFRLKSIFITISILKNLIK